MSQVAVIVTSAACAVLAVLAWPEAPRRWRPRRRSATSDPEGPAETGLVAEGLELMALALQGGGSVTSAARVVGSVLPGARGEELARVAQALEEGQDPAHAWGSAGEHWTPGRRCLELAAVAGISPGDALSRAAADLRRDAVSRAEVAAGRLGVLLVVPLGLAFLPAFVLTTIVPLVVALLRDLSW